MTKPVYEAIALALLAVRNCEQSGNSEWLAKHRDRIRTLVREHMPSGSGIDTGTTLDDRSTPDRLVFVFSFHHMNEHGSYDGWTEHTAIVTPSLAFGLDVRITGRNRNQIKDYLHETYDLALRAECNEYPDSTGRDALATD